MIKSQLFSLSFIEEIFARFCGGSAKTTRNIKMKYYLNRCLFEHHTSNWIFKETYFLKSALIISTDLFLLSSTDDQLSTGLFAVWLS